MWLFFFFFFFYGPPESTLCLSNKTLSRSGLILKVICIAVGWIWLAQLVIYYAGVFRHIPSLARSFEWPNSYMLHHRLIKFNKKLYATSYLQIDTTASIAASLHNGTVTSWPSCLVSRTASCASPCSDNRSRPGHCHVIYSWSQLPVTSTRPLAHAS